MSESTTTTRWDELTEAGRQAAARGDLAAALSAHRGALEDAEATAPDSARVASSLASLGQVCYQAKDNVEAEQLFRRALALRERLLGAEHPNVAQTLNNLAAVHVALGAMDAAEPLLLRALAITERHRGPSHPDVAVNLNNLAKLYFKRNEHARAEPLLIRLLDIEKAGGATHPKVASVLTSLASVRLALGDLLAAESLLHEAEGIVGSQHASVSAVRARLDAVRSGGTPAPSTAPDPATISGPIDLSAMKPTPGSMPASSDAPPQRRSGALPPNPWLAESEPPSVIAAESGEYDAARTRTDSHVIVPSTAQEPIAPPMRVEAPAPLPPLVVPPQVPREFNDAWGREAGESASVAATGRASVEMRAPVTEVTTGLVAPDASRAPIKEGPSVRPTNAHLEAAAAAISRFAPPPPIAPMAQPPALAAAPLPAPAPAAPAAFGPPPALPPSVAAFGPPPAAPPPMPTPARPAPAMIAPAMVAPAMIAPAPLAPPPMVAAATPPLVAPALVAPPVAPPAYVPPPMAPAVPPPLALEHDMVPMPPAALPEPAPLPRPGKASSSEGPRFAEPPAPLPRKVRKPRLQHEGTASSGGGLKLVIAALVIAALGGGGWYAFGRGATSTSALPDDDAVAPAITSPTNAAAVSPLATTAATPASATANAQPDAPVSPTTGVPAASAATPGAIAEPDDEITSSPVPKARREERVVEPAAPRPIAPIVVPIIRTDNIARSIDSTTKAKVEASLRPKVVAPTFKQTSP